MSRIRTSLNIIKQSLIVMQQHPKLLLFPLINFVGMAFIIAFFALPLLFDTNVFNAADDLPVFFEAMQERSESRQEDTGSDQVFFGAGTFEDEQMPLPFLPVAFLYLLTMFLLTFLNVAFYQQILQAFNGNPVSIRQGLAFAANKLLAIFMWSLLAGIVGLIIRKIEDNVGIVGRWIMALIGFSWSIASVFAIPVIIREQQQSNPVSYLKSSAALIKQTWGEGLAGVASISIVVFLLYLLTVPFSVLLMITMPYLAVHIMILTGIIIFCLGYLAMVVRDIFLCGLYVYASEGVAPSAFDPELLEQGWKVKKSKN